MPTYSFYLHAYSYLVSMLEWPSSQNISINWTIWQKNALNIQTILILVWLIYWFHLSTIKYKQHSSTTAFLLLLVRIINYFWHLEHLFFVWTFSSALTHLLPFYYLLIWSVLPVIMVLKASSMLCPSMALVSMNIIPFFAANSSPC